jgi:hypothetical protein
MNTWVLAVFVRMVVFVLLVCSSLVSLTIAQELRTAPSYLRETAAAFTFASPFTRGPDAARIGSNSGVAPSLQHAAEGGAIAAYAFDEGAGPVANDATGHGYHGLLMNGPAWTIGRHGGGLSLDGRDDYVDVGPVLAGGASQLTIEAWVYRRDTADSRVVCKSRGTQISDHVFCLGVVGVGERNIVRARLATSTGAGSYDSTVSFPTSTWTHVAFTYDGAHVRLFVNGTSAGTFAKAGAVVASSEAVMIGNVNRTEVRYLNGVIDDVRIYDRALSPAAIQADMATPVSGSAPVNQPPVVSLTSPLSGTQYTAPGSISLTAAAWDPDGEIARVEFFAGTTRLGAATTAPYSYVWTGVPAGSYSLTAVAYDNLGTGATSSAVTVTVSPPGEGPAPGSGAIAAYAFDEGGGAVADDASGHGHQGMLVNGPTWTTGRHEGGLSFDGRDDYVDIGPVLAGGASQLTVEAWVYRRDTNDARVVCKSRGINIPDHVFCLGVVGVGDRNIVRARLTTSTGAGSYDSTVAFPTSTWTHVAFTYDGAHVRLFVNGQAAGTFARTGAVVASPYVVTIGNVNTWAARYFNGVIDDVRIYDRALSAAAIQADMATPVSGSAPVNQPPVVSLTSPLSGTPYTAPATITMTAAASDPDGTIARVEFFAGSARLGAVTAVPYTFAWTGVPAGTYSLTAVAYDDIGASATSSAATVTVSGTTTPAPKLVVFTASADHSTNVTSYVLKIFLPHVDVATAMPIATSDLGKPTPDANGDITVDRSTFFSALAPGSYVATITAVGPGGQTQGSGVPFTR